MNINPDKKYTNISQNNCVLNTSIVNIAENKFNVDDIRKQERISNYNKKYYYLNRDVWKIQVSH